MSRVNNLIDAAFEKKGSEKIAAGVRDWANAVLAGPTTEPGSPQEANKAQASFCIQLLDATEIRAAVVACGPVFATTSQGLDRPRCDIIGCSLVTWNEATKADYSDQMRELGFRLVGTEWIRQ